MTGCDAGPKQFDAEPPPLQLVGSSPSADAGTECSSADPADCGVPVDTAITLRFDRYLRPSTAVRQSIDLYTGQPGNRVALLQPHYDVVERVVHYALSDEIFLEPGTLYTIELRVPEEAGDFGFRAFDGAALREGDVPIQFNFKTRRSDEVGQEPSEEPWVDCSRVLQIFEDAGCTTASCHGADAPKMGLALDSAEALSQTAIGKVAHQAARGPQAGVTLKSPARFGVQMPLIDPGQAGNSYLFYKLLRNPATHWASESETDYCESAYPVDMGPECLAPPLRELARLREWFVLGDPMPPDTGAPGLHRGEMRELQRFIDAGADCP